MAPMRTPPNVEFGFAESCAAAAPAVDPLVKALKDADAIVRCEASTALAAIGDRKAVPALIDALDEKDEVTKLVIIRALKTLSGGDLEETTPGPWRKWWDETGSKTPPKQ